MCLLCEEEALYRAYREQVEAREARERALAAGQTPGDAVAAQPAAEREEAAPSAETPRVD